MRFIEIHFVEELEKCINEAFKDDKKLIEEYHILGGSLLDCITDTKLKIIEESERFTLDWFMIMDDFDKIIGYAITNKELNLLYSFGLNINSRQAYKQKFFNEVRSILGDSFICGLWKKNTRGIKFLENMGMSVFSEDENIKILRLCH